MTTYYIDKNRGNDANTGLDKDEAWQTLEKFRATASTGDIAAGSNILLESSSWFEESRYLQFGGSGNTPLDGTVDNRITIGKYDYSSQYSGRPRLSYIITPESSDWVFDSDFGLWYISPPIEYGNSNQQWGGHARVTIYGNLCPIVRYQSASFTRGELPTQDYEVFIYEASQPGRLYIYSPIATNPSEYYGEGAIKASSTQRGIFAFSRCGSYLTMENLELFESGKLVNLYSDSFSTGDIVGFKLLNNFGNKVGCFADFGVIDASRIISALEIKDNTIYEAAGLGLHLSGYFNGAVISHNTHVKGNLARTDGGGVYIQSGSGNFIKGIIVSDNYYEQMNANSKGSESDGCAVYCEVRADGVLVTRNIVRDSYMAFQDNSGKNNIWSSNVAINCDTFIKVTDADNVAQVGHRTRILNNTALLRGNFWQTYSTRDYGMRLMNGPSVATNVYTFEVKNNVLTLDQTDDTRVNSTAIADVSGATLDQSGNAVYGWDLIHTRVGVTTELGLSGAITINPELIFSGRLKASSPLIETGTFLGSLQDKNSTAYQNPPSVGAYEYIRPRTAASTRTMRT